MRAVKNSATPTITIIAKFSHMAALLDSDPESRSDLVHGQRHPIGQRREAAQLEQCPLPRIAFALRDRDGRHARRGNQHEEHIRQAFHVADAA